VAEVIWVGAPTAALMSAEVRLAQSNTGEMTGSAAIPAELVEAVTCWADAMEITPAMHKNAIAQPLKISLV
jgi:hypothetical protein